MNVEELQKIMPDADPANVAAYIDPLNAAMQEFGIDTFNRVTCFVAQIAHETGEFRWMEEIASGREYEGREDLGNTEPGDGARYKGRGPFQLTGRKNYAEAGKALGVDLISNPERATEPELGFRIAAWFWQTHELNELADEMNFQGITRRINGGFNGLADRQRFLRRAQAALQHDQNPANDAEIPKVFVEVNGQEVVLQNPPLMRAGHFLLPLRDLANEANWRIMKAERGSATIRDRDGSDHKLALHMEGKVGYVFAIDLWATSNWNPSSRILSIRG